MRINFNSIKELLYSASDELERVIDKHGHARTELHQLLIAFNDMKSKEQLIVAKALLDIISLVVDNHDSLHKMNSLLSQARTKLDLQIFVSLILKSRVSSPNLESFSILLNKVITNIEKASGDLKELFSPVFLGEETNQEVIMSLVLALKGPSEQLDNALVAAKNLEKLINRVKENTLGFDDVIPLETNWWFLIHPKISTLVKVKFDAGFYADAVESALKEVNKQVKIYVYKSTGKELDGAGLMTTAFSLSTPIVSLNTLSTESERNIQQGYMQIFAGAMTGIRNPKAHDNIILDKSQAIHLIFLSSLLIYKLEEAGVISANEKA